MTRLHRWWRERNRWKSCPHNRLRGIYGDEIIFGTPNFNRLWCRDCGSFLRGPVGLAEERRKSKFGPI